MKKYFIITLMIFASLSAFSQRRGQVIKWFSIAAKGGIGNSVLFNSDAFNEQGADLNMFTLSHAYGGRFTFTYGDNLGFGVDIMSISFGQDYSLRTETQAYNKNLDLSSLDYTLFFRYTGNYGGYFEIGPTFTHLKTAQETNSIEGAFFPRDDLMNVYENRYTNLMVGFGMAALKSDRIDINIGARLNYGFKDIVSDPTQYVLNDGVFMPSVISDKATNPLSLKLLVELNYYFAFWGDASCGQGRLMFFQ